MYALYSAVVGISFIMHNIDHFDVLYPKQPNFMRILHENYIFVGKFMQYLKNYAVDGT